MLNPSLIVFLVFALTSAVFSQENRDLREWGVKGKVRRINDYYIYSNPGLNSTKRSLSYISIFNRRGNLRVQLEIVRGGTECYYKKTVYLYDRKNRRKAIALYKSENNRVFCEDIPSLEQEAQSKISDSGKISLIENKTFEYDRKERLVRETVFDKTRTIVQENKYEYNTRGENTRYTIIQKNNRISGASSTFVKKMDSRIVYQENGMIKETCRYEDEKLLYKDIDYMDKQKRLFKEEQYKLETDSQNRVIKETLGSFSKSYYQENNEVLDWTIYDDAGKLSSQLYILSENGNELMRLEYTPRDAYKGENRTGSQKLTHYQFDSAAAVRPEINRRLKYLLKFDKCVESPDWIATRFEARFYKFDAAGNKIQSLFMQQDSPAKEEKSESIYERELTYYK